MAPKTTLLILEPLACCGWMPHCMLISCKHKMAHDLMEFIWSWPWEQMKLVVHAVKLAFTRKIISWCASFIATENFKKCYGWHSSLGAKRVKSFLSWAVPVMLCFHYLYGVGNLEGLTSKHPRTQVTFWCIQLQHYSSDLGWSATHAFIMVLTNKICPD